MTVSTDSGHAASQLITADGGGTDAEVDVVTNAVAQVLTNALNQSAQRCAGNVAYTERVLYLAHVLAVLGASDADDTAFTMQCPHEPALSGAQKIFTGGWIVTHQSEVNQQGHYILLNWTPGTGDVLAQKTYDQTLAADGGTSVTQQSTLTIKYATEQ